MKQLLALCLFVLSLKSFAHDELGRLRNFTALAARSEYERGVSLRTQVSHPTMMSRTFCFELGQFSSDITQLMAFLDGFIGHEKISLAFNDGQKKEIEQLRFNILHHRPFLKGMCRNPENLKNSEKLGVLEKALSRFINSLGALR